MRTPFSLQAAAALFEHMALAASMSHRDHHLGIPIDDDVRVVGRDDHLPRPFAFSQLRDNEVRNQPVVEIVLWLIENDGLLAVRQQERQHGGGLLTW